MHVSDVELSEFKSLPGQSIREEKDSLLRIMFYIGHRQFDQLLTGSMSVDYTHWLQTPMSMNAERAWIQIGQRPEFQESAKLSVQETVMVAFIAAQCKT